MRVLPINIFVVEDISAKTQEGKRRWNASFSPLEVGKNWFYSELKKLGKLETRQGYETAEYRNICGLKKSKNKLKESFYLHCVDSWVLAREVVGGPLVPDNLDMIYIAPIRLHRRQLHALQPAENGVRRPYGGTQSMELKRGSLIRHNKYRICYVGGTLKGKISLHSIESGKRLCQNGKVEDCKILTWNTWKIRGATAPFLPSHKRRGFLRAVL